MTTPSDTPLALDDPILDASDGPTRMLLAAEYWKKAYKEAERANRELQAELAAAQERKATSLLIAQTAISALKKLSFTAQTSGGVAGRDEGLQEAIKEAEYALSYTAVSRAIDAAQAKDEPVGWKLVPIEPTDGMCKAGSVAAEYAHDDVYNYEARVIYIAMLAAAPPPVSGE